MGFFSTLFGSSKPSENHQFDTLRDDGVRAMQMGEVKYAEKCFKAALQIKHDTQTVSYLAETYLRMQDFDNALPYLKEIAEAETDTFELRILLAQTQGELKQYQDELATCQLILSTDPNEPRALYLSAEAEHGLHDDLQAIVHLTQCLSLREDFQRALQLRAEILGSMGQWNEALTDIDALLKLNDDHEDFIILHAKACAYLGRTDEAQNNLIRVRELNPFNQEAILHLGSLYEQTGQRDKALTLYDEAIELLPQFAAAYKARGGVKHALKDDAGAAKDLKKALELDPEKAIELDGEYSTIENKMNNAYRNMNPYGF